jgi:hypothetical protein
MSKHAIQSLERSIDALSTRIGTPWERQQDVSMVAYLRQRIAEIQAKHADKKRGRPSQRDRSDQRTDNSILAVSTALDKCFDDIDADLRFVNSEVQR